MAIVPTDVLFERYHRELLADVSHVVPASPETIEDACSATWAIAARRAIREDTAYRWLFVVAVRAARRLHQRDLRAHADAGAPLSSCRDQADPAQVPHSLAVWRDAFRRLRPRQRQVLGLSLAGLDYARSAPQRETATAPWTASSCAPARACDVSSGPDREARCAVGVGRGPRSPRLEAVPGREVRREDRRDRPTVICRMTSRASHERERASAV